MAFGSKTDQKTGRSSSTSFLGKGTYIDGVFNVEGNVRIDGRVKGEIKGDADVIIGEGSLIEANISVTNITIMGEVTGNVICSEKLEIHNTGKVIGEISADKLIIEENAFFEGKSMMHQKKEIPALPESSKKQSDNKAN
ncbi:MAG: polymer-forming cytoskeletal protein [Caldisericia bacterium]|nr:polymer-forming cytoskeletal protein [Caldisericia bacterium]